MWASLPNYLLMLPYVDSTRHSQFINWKRIENGLNTVFIKYVEKQIMNTQCVLLRIKMVQIVLQININTLLTFIFYLYFKIGLGI